MSGDCCQNTCGLWINEVENGLQIDSQDHQNGKFMLRNRSSALWCLIGKVKFLRF